MDQNVFFDVQVQKKYSNLTITKNSCLMCYWTYLHLCVNSVERVSRGRQAAIKAYRQEFQICVSNNGKAKNPTFFYVISCQSQMFHPPTQTILTRQQSDFELEKYSMLCVQAANTIFKSILRTIHLQCLLYWLSPSFTKAILRLKYPYYLDIKCSPCPTQFTQRLSGPYTLSGF